jgi:hypothetical protein
MAPPKLAEPGQTARSTRVQTRSRGPLEENEQQQPEIVDIDEIPSPEEIPVDSTPILEEIQQPQAEAMEQDTPAVVQEPQNKEAETQQEIQPEHTEAAVEVNRTTQHLGAEEQPDETQAPDLGQPAEETTGTTWAWPEWMTGEQPRSCWNFEPATTAGGQSSDTELTSQETDSRNCATSHTRGSTGRPAAIGSRREAQVF